MSDISRCRLHFAADTPFDRLFSHYADAASFSTLYCQTLDERYHFSPPRCHAEMPDYAAATLIAIVGFRRRYASRRRRRRDIFPPVFALRRCRH